MFINRLIFFKIFIEHIDDYFVYICTDLLIKHSVNMVKSFIDLEIKRFDEDDFSVECHPQDKSNRYYLRFRRFYPSGEGAESEYWFPSLRKCISFLVQLLARYWYLI